MKLSNRAIAILCRIREASEGTGMFWSPTLDYITNGDWCEEVQSRLYISGSGDARILDSLRNKGLTKSCSRHGSKYACSITEDGILAIEKARESGQLEQVKAECQRRVNS